MRVGKTERKEKKSRRERKQIQERRDRERETETNDSGGRAPDNPARGSLSPSPAVAFHFFSGPFFFACESHRGRRMLGTEKSSGDFSKGIFRQKRKQIERQKKTSVGVQNKKNKKKVRTFSSKGFFIGKVGREIAATGDPIPSSSFFGKELRVADEKGK